MRMLFKQRAVVLASVSVNPNSNSQLTRILYCDQHSESSDACILTIF